MSQNVPKCPIFEMFADGTSVRTRRFPDISQICCHVNKADTHPAAGRKLPAAGVIHCANDMPRSPVLGLRLAGRLRQIAGFSRPEHQVPVVAHQAVPEDAHFNALSPLLQDRDERGKIAGLSKNVHAAVAAIHHVIVTSLAADTERACRGMAPVSPNSSGRQREAGVSPRVSFRAWSEGSRG
jgi:hypothetical protein